MKLFEGYIKKKNAVAKDLECHNEDLAQPSR